jgi:ribosomal protein S18 acetylase RimI-like enzyme
MKIKKFDLKTDDLDIVIELITKGYGESGQEISRDENTKILVGKFVQFGNNFIGHENIYLCLIGGEIAGLVIGYSGKSINKLRAIFDLLCKFKLYQILNYLLISSSLFDSVYTPKLNVDDFYISVIVVHEKFRNHGVGSFLLSESILIAKECGCKKIVLDVNISNYAALSLYNKFGFSDTGRDDPEHLNNRNKNSQTMIYKLN